MNKIFGIIRSRAVFQNIRLLYCGHYQVKLYHHINYDTPINTCCIQGDPKLLLIKRLKHKKKGSAKKMEEEVDESDEEDELEQDESKSKSMTINIKVQSLRVDTVAKSGLGIARKKIEDAFFESKIRINGKKVFKLSTEVKIDDEIDLIRGRSDDNPNFLIVSRIIVLSMEPASDGIRLKLSRDKTLLIEDYTEPWRN